MVEALINTAPPAGGRLIPAEPPQLGRRLLGLGADLILQGQRSDDLATPDEVEHRGAPGCPLLDAGAERLRFGQLSFPQQCGPADGVTLAIDGSLHAATGDR